MTIDEEVEVLIAPVRLLARPARFRRPISAACFGLVPALFLLPIATVSSCGGERVEVSGVEIQLVGVVSLLAGPFSDRSLWPIVGVALIPVLALVGLIMQLRPSRIGVPVTLGISAIGLMTAIASGALLAIDGSLQWRPAFYAATAFFLPPGWLSAGELLKHRRKRDQFPARLSPQRLLVGYVGAIALTVMEAIILAAIVLSISLYGESARTHQPAANSSARPSNDTWIWAGTDWRLQSPKQRPPARDEAAFVFDEAHGQLVLYGGVDHNDTWTWDGRNWTQRHPSTAPDSPVGTLVYDSQLKEVVFIDKKAHLWALGDLDWRAIATTGGPRTIEYTGTTGTAVYAGYDKKRAELVVLTDSWQTNGTRSVYETWVWNGSQWRLAASETNAISAGPDPNGTSDLIYDSDREQLLSIGSSEMWTWNGATWKKVDKPLVGYGAGAYDSLRHELIYVFTTSSAATWRWDGTTWSPSDAKIKWISDPAHHVAIAYDATRGVVVVFG